MTRITDRDMVGPREGAARPSATRRPAATGAPDGSSPERSGRSFNRSWLLVAVVVVVLGAGAVAALLLTMNNGGRSPEGPVAWSTLRTQDIHALAFDVAHPERLLFGHHGGLLETRDGGRTWQATALQGADAMNIGRPAGGFFQIAGHAAYTETTDGGSTWQNVPNDLPGSDLHLFVADPQNNARAWAFSVGYGLFETGDQGRTWQLRQPGTWGALATFAAGSTVLLAINDAGLRRSDDGGRTWTPLTLPGGQAASLAASADGTAIYVGTTNGLARSTDGGATWSATGLPSIAVALAVSPLDARSVAVVDEQGRLFRSFDGGQTWPAPRPE